MRLRKAERGDLDAILAIEGSWETSPHWKRSQFEAELNSDSAVFLVAEDCGLAGYGVLWILPPEAQLLNLAVVKQRQGVGRMLMTALVDEARRRRCERLTLEVSAANDDAQRFYRSLGGRVVGRRPKFYNGSVDAILMDLVIL